MDGLLSTHVEKDGEDATVRIIEMINDCKFKPQLQAVFLDGIAVGGFNVVNPRAVHKETGVPVVVVIREKPDFGKMFRALKKLGMEKKIDIIKAMPAPEKVNDVYVQNIGISNKDTVKLLDITCTHSYLPEAIRVAHLIASGVADGQSRGRA